VVNFVKLGTYRIKYTVTNPDNGKTTNKTLKIQVVDTKRPTLTNVSKSKKVQYGTKVNIRSGIRAKAATGANLTSKIVISVKVPGGSKYKVFKNNTYTFNKLGKYYVNYKVTNPRNNKSATARMQVNVVDTKKPEITNLPANQTVEYKTTLDLVSKVKATAATGVNVKSNMKVYIKAPGADYVLFKKQQYTFSKLGSYAIRYEATNPQNKKTKIQKRTITVVDTKVPTLSGVMANKQVEYKSVLDMKAGVTAKSGAAENLTANITVTMKKPSAIKYTALTTNNVTFDEVGTYAFKYTIVNPKNNKSASKTVQITVADTSAPVISGVPAAPESYNQNDSLNVLTGITAATTAGGVNLTSQVVVTVTSPSNAAVHPASGVISLTETGTYKIVYQVTYNSKTVTATRDITVN